MSKLKTMAVHPVARLFPTIPAQELAELKADIEANGIRIPILVNKKGDTILDGRTRYMIASDLKLGNGDVPTEKFEGKDEEIPGAIIARNILRRHLSDGQRALLIAKIRGPQIEKEAEARMKAGHPVDISTPGKGRAWEQLADEAKVSERTARAALNVNKYAADDIKADVASGNLKLSKAVKSRRPKAAKTLTQIVESKFQRFMEKFPIQRHREVRKLLRELL